MGDKNIVRGGSGSGTQNNTDQSMLSMGERVKLGSVKSAKDKPWEQYGKEGHFEVTIQGDKTAQDP